MCVNIELDLEEETEQQIIELVLSELDLDDCSTELLDCSNIETFRDSLGHAMVNAFIVKSLERALFEEHQ